MRVDGISLGAFLLIPAVLWSQVEQDYSALRINEVIPSNITQPPLDVLGGYPDMIEIYNSGDTDLLIGSENEESSLVLSDRESLPCKLGFPSPDPSDLNNYWALPARTVVPARRSITVFCDRDVLQGLCELHAPFEIKKTGEEPITIWGPEIGKDENGCTIREMIDQVWLPPLPQDVSFGRFPDGAGPAPVPLDEVFDTLVFNPPGESTFGTCLEIPVPQPCGFRRLCLGGENGPGGNLPPRITFPRGLIPDIPAAGDAVSLVIRLRDDRPTPPENFERVQIVYRVDGGPWLEVDMSYDETSGLLDGSDEGKPLDRWTLWTGQIPGQATGTQVEFCFRARDVDGAEIALPEILCDDGVGPCLRNFGGEGCSPDPIEPGKYLPCDRPFGYVSGHPVSEDATHLVINEVVANQVSILVDPTNRFPCEFDSPFCGFEDFIEIHNTSTEPMSLSGFTLSDRLYEPGRWRFPEGSQIPPKGYTIVWCDNDGGKCPDPDGVPIDPEWLCPDPNFLPPDHPAAGQYHTNFVLDESGDSVYLFEATGTGSGLVFGVSFESLPLDASLSLCPDGDRGGRFVVTPDSTPGSPNTPAACAIPFLRADCNDDGAVDISDPIATLGILFLGEGAAPCDDACDANDDGLQDISDPITTLAHLFLGAVDIPPPGIDDCGPDPTGDGLSCLESETCSLRRRAR